MTIDVKTIRFRKAAYRGKNSSGDEPRWHKALYGYKKGEIYVRYVARCGYTIDDAILKNVRISEAKRPKGELCSKCEAHR